MLLLYATNIPIFILRPSYIDNINGRYFFTVFTEGTPLLPAIKKCKNIVSRSMDESIRYRVYAFVNVCFLIPLHNCNNTYVPLKGKRTLLYFGSNRKRFYHYHLLKFNNVLCMYCFIFVDT